MKEVVVLVSMNVLGFIIGWLFADKISEWINSSKYSRGIKATLHTLMWGAIIVGGIVNGIPAWITGLTIVAYIMSIFGVFVD